MVLWRKHAPGSLKCQLCLHPYSSLSDMSMTEKALVQHPALEIGPSSPSWGKKEQTVFVDAPLVPETVVSHNSGIPAYGSNPFSHVQAVDNGSI